MCFERTCGGPSLAGEKMAGRANSRRGLSLLAAVFAGISPFSNPYVNKSYGEGEQ